MDLYRTHLNNTSARDMSQFLQDQGATTMVYHVVLRGGSDTGIAEIGHIPAGCCDFLVPLRYASVAVHQAQLPRQCPACRQAGLCGYEKVACNAGWRYY